MPSHWQQATASRYLTERQSVDCLLEPVPIVTRKTSRSTLLDVLESEASGAVGARMTPLRSPTVTLPALRPSRRATRICRDEGTARVALALPPGPEFVELVLAISSLGAAAAPLNPDTASQSSLSISTIYALVRCFYRRVDSRLHGAPRNQTCAKPLETNCLTGAAN